MKADSDSRASLVMTPDRERVLMSSELRSLLGNARGVAPEQDDPADDTTFRAACEAMLVLERDAADGSKDHVVGTLAPGARRGRHGRGGRSRLPRRQAA